LAIVRGLVELHGGQIRATSEGTSLGASFTFSLPVASNEVELISPEERTDKAVAFQPRGVEDPDARTVLVVEDDRDQREIICDMLEMEGYHVVLTEDGEEAVALARSLLPSAIALDVMLPRSDGWEVLSRLKTDETTRDIPVLIISVVDQQDLGKKLGADEYLIKPLEAASLRSAVRRLVEDAG
jgi:CheY-like chemotaxis protein